MKKADVHGIQEDLTDLTNKNRGIHWDSTECIQPTKRTICRDFIMIQQADFGVNIRYLTNGQLMDGDHKAREKTNGWGSQSCKAISAISLKTV